MSQHEPSGGGHSVSSPFRRERDLAAAIAQILDENTRLWFENFWANAGTDFLGRLKAMRSWGLEAQRKYLRQLSDETVANWRSHFKSGPLWFHFLSPSPAMVTATGGVLAQMGYSSVAPGPKIFAFDEQHSLWTLLARPRASTLIVVDSRNVFFEAARANGAFDMPSCFVFNEPWLGAQPLAVPKLKNHQRDRQLIGIPSDHVLLEPLSISLPMIEIFQALDASNPSQEDEALLRMLFVDFVLRNPAP